MKINDIICETAGESRDLQGLARAVAQRVEQAQGQTGSFKGTELGYQAKEPAVAQTLAGLTFSVINNPNIDDLANFNPNNGLVQINYPRVEEEAEDNNRSFVDELYKTLVHELQHSIDAYKSKNKAVMGQVVPKGSEYSDEEQQAYLKLPHEVNARFAEALADINDQLPYVRDSGQLPALINDAFARRELNSVFPNKTQDPAYKKLLARAYKFYTAYLDANKAPTDAAASKYVLGK